MSAAMGYWKKDVHRMVTAVALDIRTGLVGTHAAAEALDAFKDERLARAIAIEWLVDQARAQLRNETLHQERVDELEAAARLVQKKPPWRETEVGKRTLASWARSEAYRQSWAAEQARVHDAVESRAILMFTLKLRSSTFTMPDGTRVAWGCATAEQHAERIEMLMKNAVGNIQAASRHQAAIETILEFGVTCLDETEITAA